MISLREVAEELEVQVVTGEGALNRPVAAGYATDLLSCAMNRAKKDYIWVTLQAHVNVVAVASLLDLSGVIITEGNTPDPDTIARAESEGVALLLTPKPTFAVVSELAALGVLDKPEQE